MITMEKLLPSEIARLVLGYLIDTQCVEAEKIFSTTSLHLHEYRYLASQNVKLSTTVRGLSLLNILDQFHVFTTFVQNKFNKVSKSKELRHCENIIEQLELLIKISEEKRSPESRDVSTQTEFSEKTPGVIINAETQQYSAQNLTNRSHLEDHSSDDLKIICEKSINTVQSTPLTKDHEISEKRKSNVNTLITLIPIHYPPTAQQSNPVILVPINFGNASVTPVTEQSQKHPTDLGNIVPMCLSDGSSNLLKEELLDQNELQIQDEEQTNSLSSTLTDLNVPTTEPINFQNAYGIIDSATNSKTDLGNILEPNSNLISSFDEGPNLLTKELLDHLQNQGAEEMNISCSEEIFEKSIDSDDSNNSIKLTGLVEGNSEMNKKKYFLRSRTNDNIEYRPPIDGERQEQNSFAVSSTKYEDILNNTTNLKKKFTRLQIEVLQKHFKKNKYLIGSESQALAMLIGETDARVRTWFQNKRRDWRKKKLLRRKTK